MSKGSRRRPQQKTHQEIQDNWDRIFKREDIIQNRQQEEAPNMDRNGDGGLDHNNGGPSHGQEGSKDDEV